MGLPITKYIRSGMAAPSRFQASRQSYHTEMIVRLRGVAKE